MIRSRQEQSNLDIKFETTDNNLLFRWSNNQVHLWTKSLHKINGCHNQVVLTLKWSISWYSIFLKKTWTLKSVNKYGSSGPIKLINLPFRNWEIFLALTMVLMSRFYCIWRWTKVRATMPYPALIHTAIIS